MWGLSNAVQNILDVINNRFLKYLLQPIFDLFGRYLRYRVKKHYYTFVPEMLIFRYVHKVIFRRWRLIFK
jgi:hypothetical protein